MEFTGWPKGRITGLRVVATWDLVIGRVAKVANPFYCTISIVCIAWLAAWNKINKRQLESTNILDIADRNGTP